MSSRYVKTSISVDVDFPRMFMQYCANASDGVVVTSQIDRMKLAGAQLAQMLRGTYYDESDLTAFALGLAPEIAQVQSAEASAAYLNLIALRGEGGKFSDFEQTMLDIIRRDGIISAIKYVRKTSTIGLKEAKDWCEDVRSRGRAAGLVPQEDPGF